MCLLGTLGGPRFLLVSVFRPVSFLVSEGDFYRDSDGPGSLNDAPLAPLPCFSDADLALTLSFSQLLSLLSL